METQFRLIDAPTKKEIKIPPLASIRARILALKKGIPYSQAVRELLDEELAVRRAEREDGHAP